jgi:FKBP-type peptidyl-prolyl cis-trans isomerase (trigger factor)
MDSLKESRKLKDLDDSFARGMGYPDLAQLEEVIQRQIFIQKERQQRQKIESDIIEHITKDMDFKLPQRLVERQLEDLLRQGKLDLALRGMPAEKVEEQAGGMKQELEPQAKRQVKVYLILSAIAKTENIPQDDHMTARVMEFLLKEANWQEQAA